MLPPRILRARVHCVVVVAALQACVMQTVTTELRVRDPHAVTLRNARSEVVIAPGAEAVAAPLAEGRMSIDLYASAGYAVQARREANGEINVAWVTSLPLASGERATVMPAVGALTLNLAGGDVVSAEQLRAPTLVLPWCTRLASHAYHGVVNWSVQPRECVGGPTLDPLDIDHPGTVHYALEVAWTDVTTLREHTRPDNAVAWAAMGGSTLLAGTFGGFFLGLSNSSVAGGAATKYTFAGTLIGIALAVDLLMLPTLLAHDTDRNLRP